MSSGLPSRPRTVCYLAGTDAAASEGAAALEAVPSGPQRTVRPLPTDAIDRLEEAAADADCVVFAETPTTAAGATLLEAVEACGETPLILFTDASYGPTAARSTDGIDGYVRRDTDDAVAHLADEIEWRCAGGASGAASAADGTNETASTDDAANGTAPNDDTESDAIAMPGERATTSRESNAEPRPASTDRRESAAEPRSEVDRLLEAIPAVVACDDRDRLFDRLVESAAAAFETDACWLSTVHFGEFAPRATADGLDDDLESLPREGALGDCLRTGEALRVDDLASDDRLDAPLEGLGSLCCASVGDAGLLLVGADDPSAFDDRDCDRLAAWGRLGAAVLERLETETRLRNDRDRLRGDVEGLESQRDRLAAERDDLAAELDRARSLFANAPAPAVRYEIADGRPIVRDVNDAFTAVFDADPGAVVDRPIDADTVPPGLEHRRSALIEALRAGERRRLVSRRETADGVRAFRLTLVPLEGDGDGADAGRGDTDGTASPGGLVVYRDVTEAKRRERELAAAEQRLEAVAELLEEEVRSPLNVARGYLELAEATGDAEHFAEIEEAQERLRERLADLLAVARRDAAPAETEPVAITDVARRAWVTVETGDARLVTGENRVLEADKARLRELFEHLFRTVVENVTTADDETGDAERTPVVTVGATDDGFAVTGRRRGGDERGLERDPAPVAGQLAAADGAGVGLGPVERIADAHGWEVCVGEDGDGTDFVFRGIESGEVGGD